MSAKKKAALSKSTAVMVRPWDAAEGAVIVFAGIDKITELTTLAAESSHITEITNDAGRDQVHALRMVLKNRRLEIAETGLEARRQALSFNKKVGAQEVDYIDLIQPEESRLQKLQDDYDAALEQQKQALIDAEIARQAALQGRIAELRGCQTLSPTSGSALIAEHIADLERIVVDESFEECREQAETAKAEGLARLDDLFIAALCHEAEQQRIADERAELARLRQEAAERAAADAERERQAKVARDAEEARRAAQLKQQAEEAAREQAARQKIIDDNNARITAEQKAAQEMIDAETKRQADAAEVARQPVATVSGPTVKLESGGRREPFGNLASYADFPVEPVMPEPIATKLATPASEFACISNSKLFRDEIISTLCNEFGLDALQVIAVLSQIDWRAALAEAA